MPTTTRFNAWAAAALVASAALLAACGGGGTTSVFTQPQPATGNLAGGVLDANTGAAVAGASVQTGSLSTTSATDGKFSFTALTPATRQVIKLNATGYAEHIVVTHVAANITTHVSTQLLPLGATALVDVSAGGAVTVPSSSGQVVIPGGALSGTGNATVSVTPVNGSLNPGFLPGDFSVGGTTQPLESFGAVIVTATNGSGAAVPVVTGGLITIRIPVSSRATALPSVLPLYYLDTVTGHWVREGTAALGGTAPSQYYEAMVSHAGTWSVDQPYETVNATGCVVDLLGTRVAAARVVAEGIDYTGSTSIDTDSAGNFVLPMKKSGLAALTARSGGKTSNSVAAGPSAADFSAGGCLALTDQANNVTIKLTWADAPADVDSHLYTPAGDHIYFDNKGGLSSAPWANLDVDDLTSFGPEITTLRRLQVGTYTYAVNNFSATFAPGLTASPTRVELNIGGASTAHVPPAGEGTSTWWTVFTFSVDAQCGVTVTPVNTWSATPPVGPVAGGAVVYCTAP